MLRVKKFIVLIISLVLIVSLVACRNQNQYSKVVDEYDVSRLGVDFEGRESCEIGANIKGMPVFKDPNRALNQAQIDYKEGFDAIAEEFDFKPLNRKNFRIYGKHGWQLTTGTDEAKRQGSIISQFFDIYENSFQ